MTTDRGALAALLATMTMLASAGPAMAQTEQTAPVRGLEGLANPTPQTNATVPIPDAPKIVLPTETPTPRPTPSQRPASRPAAQKANAEKTPAERPATRNEPEKSTRSATDSARSSTPAEPASATGSAPEATVAPPSAQVPRINDAPEPAPQSAPTAAATPTPAPATSPQPTITAPETGRAMPLWLSLAVIVVVLAALWALRRKPRGRRQDQDVETFVEPLPDPVASEPVSRPVADASSVESKTTPAAATAAPAVAAIPTTAIAAPKFLEPRAKMPPSPPSPSPSPSPPPAAPRARLTCDLRPLRAGLNLLSATVECELVVTNTGTAPAEAIRTGVALLTAHTGQDVDLAVFNAAPVVRPVAAPFALAPGETRTLRTVVAVSREAIRTMTAANRPMFVPVVAANVRYVTAGADAQTARAWSIGIERVDSPKLAPFWLDAPARMYSSVAARPHAAEFDS